MPTGKQELERVFSRYSVRKENVPERISGVLGITTGGERTVEVSSRAGYVWVRLRNVENEVIQAYNDSVSIVYDLPVIVSRDKNHPTRYIIVGRDIERYANNWGTNSTYLPKHGNQHSFNRDDSGTGGDVVWVYSQQFMPFLVIPSGSSGAGNVVISAGVNSYGGNYTYVGNTGTADLLSYKPTGSTANLLLVYLEQDTGNFSISEGGSLANTVTGTAQVVAELPAPATGTVGLAGIRLVSGTSSIGWANIYDVRPFFVASTPDPGGGGGGGGAPTDAQYVTMALDGDLSAERVLTAGTDIGLADGGANGNATVSVLSGTFSRPGHVHNWAIPIYDDGVFRVTGTAISFDDNLLVEVTGTVAYVSMTGSAQGGHTIQDDDETFAQRTNLKFIGGGFHVSDDAGSDATIVSGTHCGTYQRTAEAEPLDGLTGLAWKVPENVFASGSLAVFQDGSMLRVAYDYNEQFWVSGTYLYTSPPATGTVHMVTYGIPCYTQYYPSTGTAPPTGDALLMESGDYLLLESGDKILLEGA